MEDDEEPKDPEINIKAVKEEIMTRYQDMCQLFQKARVNVVNSGRQMSRLAHDCNILEADRADMLEAHSLTVQILEDERDMMKTERDMMENTNIAAEIRLAHVLHDAEERSRQSEAELAALKQDKKRKWDKIGEISRIVG